MVKSNGENWITEGSTGSNRAELGQPRAKRGQTVLKKAKQSHISHVPKIPEILNKSQKKSLKSHTMP